MEQAVARKSQFATNPKKFEAPLTGAPVAPIGGKGRGAVDGDGLRARLPRAKGRRPCGMGDGLQRAFRRLLAWFRPWRQGAIRRSRHAPLPGLGCRVSAIREGISSPAALPCRPRFAILRAFHRFR